MESIETLPTNHDNHSLDRIVFEFLDRLQSFCFNELQWLRVKVSDIGDDQALLDWHKQKAANLKSLQTLQLENEIA